MKNLWIVGQYRGMSDDGTVWDYQGVFSSKDGAIAACRSSDYFIAPVELDFEIPERAADWPGIEYPV